MDEISLEFGEMLYQLRAALDALVYELAIVASGQEPPPDAERLEFPIRSTEASFDKAVFKIRPLSEHHQTLLRRLQTFPVPAQTDATRLMAPSLKLLNDWARKDRHRGLHVMASWAANRDPLVRAPAGCTVESLIATADGRGQSEPHDRHRDRRTVAARGRRGHAEQSRQDDESLSSRR